jgi:HlyD family secretion protein
MDQFRFNRMSLEAQLEVAKANVEVAQGSLANSVANLEYTEIKAPVDGIIIDKKVDQGQTLAATFQMPELFVIAPDMDKKMLVFANVDEADIGHIRQAQESQQPVSFKVDAYREEVFNGVVSQIRLNPTTTQNVVTYTVVVEAPNPELKLLPGMTANLEFQVRKHQDVLRVPNAALRYFPLPEHVRTEDRKLVEGMVEAREEQDQRREAGLPAEIDEGPRMKRHVWLKKGELLQAVEVTVGISDSKYSELLAGDVPAGTQLATGLQPKT